MRKAWSWWRANKWEHSYTWSLNMILFYWKFQWRSVNLLTNSKNFETNLMSTLSKSIHSFNAHLNSHYCIWEFQDLIEWVRLYQNWKVSFRVWKQRRSDRISLIPAEELLQQSLKKLRPISKLGRLKIPPNLVSWRTLSATYLLFRL